MGLNKEVKYEFTTKESFFRAIDEIVKLYPDRVINGFVAVEENVPADRADFSFDELEVSEVEDYTEFDTWDELKNIVLDIIATDKWMHGQLIVEVR